MNDTEITQMSKKITESDIKKIQKLLGVLQEYKVKEYKSENLHLIIDTIPYTDTFKHQRSLLQQEMKEAKGYGPTY